MNYRAISIGLALTLAVAGSSCSRGRELRHVTAQELEGQLDFSDLTPGEQRRFETVANSEVSPCGDDVTLALALFNLEQCPLAQSAGLFVIEMVKADYREDEISDAYVARYAAAEGLRIPLDGSPRIGAEEPKVTLVVFTDFECPYCARAAVRFTDLLAAHPGKIAVVVKHFPLSNIHPLAELAARAAIAAGLQEKFWEMHDTIFSAAGSPLTEERIVTMAAGLGLDMPQFKEDLSSAAATSVLAADRALGEKLGVNGTPTVFLNGRAVDNSLTDLESRIEEELVRAESRP